MKSSKKRSSDSRHYLKVSILQARNLKPIKGRASDPYVLMNLTSDKSKLYKSMRQQTDNPKWNELFHVALDDSVVVDGSIHDTLIVKVVNWSRVGTPNTMGKIEIDLSNVQSGESEEEWYDLERGGQVCFIVEHCVRVEGEELVKPKKNKKGYIRSVTRTTTSLSKKVRTGEDLVPFVTVTVHSASNLPGVADDGTSNPYFFLKLTSTKTRKKSQKKSSTTNPMWERTYGFPLDATLDGKIFDGIVLDIMSYNLIGRATQLGSCYIPLNGVEIGEQIRSVDYPVENSYGTESTVKVSIDIEEKTWSEIQAQDSELVDSLNRKLIYCLNIMRQKLTDNNLAAVVSLSVTLAVLQVRLEVEIDPMSAQQTTEEDLDDLLDDDDETGENLQEETTQETKSFMKKTLLSGIDKMLVSLSKTRERMEKLGVTGVVGASAIIGAFGVEFEIGVDISLA